LRVFYLFPLFWGPLFFGELKVFAL
jgi:hypothetical protein